jgi:hypothetical protein
MTIQEREITNYICTHICIYLSNEFRNIEEILCSDDVSSTLAHDFKAQNNVFLWIEYFLLTNFINEWQLYHL